MAFALAAVKWNISLKVVHTRGWLENTVMSGVKLIPLGQSAGQKILFTLTEQIPEIVEQSAYWPQVSWSFTPAHRHCRSRHEHNTLDF